MKNKHIHSALFGIAVGDALGVPVEFRSRDHFRDNPVKDMLAYGTHNQPAGTCSDDSSLTFCLAETLIDGYDLRKLANRFINWYEYGYWTPHRDVFDVGVATSKAIIRLRNGTNPLLAGDGEESDNGNGSLMRILSILFYIKDMSIVDRFSYVKEVSSLTHRHIRSVLACFIYIEFALQLLKKANKYEALTKTIDIVKPFLIDNPVCPEEEINLFHRILSNPAGENGIKPIYEYAEEEIASSGYVIDNLEAALWCIFNNAIIKAPSYVLSIWGAIPIQRPPLQEG